MTLAIHFHAPFCWMRIERVQRASEHGLGSKAGPRRPFKFSNCALALWTRSICIQRYSGTKWIQASAMLVSVPQTHRNGPEGGGGTSIIDGGGDVPLDRVWFPVITIDTGYLNRPNWLLAGYSVYHRVASQPTMFMTGPRSRHQIFMNVWCYTAE